MNVVWTTGPAKTQPGPKRGSEKTRSRDITPQAHEIHVKIDDNSSTTIS